MSKNKNINKTVISGLSLAILATTVTSPSLGATTINNGTDALGNQNMSDIGKYTYVQPNESYETTLKNIETINDARFRSTLNLDDDLIELSKASIDSTKGIVTNSSLTQNEVINNLKWFGDWEETEYYYKRKLTNYTNDGSNYLTIKDYGIYFDIDEKVSVPVNLKINIDYLDISGNGGYFEVDVRNNLISFNKIKTEEVEVSFEYTNSVTGEVVDAPILYRFGDADNGGSLGIKDEDMYLFYTYYGTPDNSVDVYTPEDSTQHLFNYNYYYPYVEELVENNVINELYRGNRSRYYYVNNDRSRLNAFSGIDNADGNILPVERGWQRLKMTKNNGYITVLDSWGINSNSYNGASYSGYSYTSGKESEYVMYVKGSTTMTMNESNAFFNVPDNEMFQDSLIVSPFNVKPVLSANDKYKDFEHTTYTDAELISKYDVFYNVMSNSKVTVDQSKIDYTTPGIYPITFTHSYNDGSEPFVVESTYEVVDILPTITSLDVLEVDLNSDVLNYLVAYNAKSTEINKDDLNSAIIITGLDKIPVKDGKYVVTGTYDIVFHVQDAEGNKVSTPAKLIIKNDLSDDEHTDIGIIDNTVNVVPLEIDTKDKAEGPEETVLTDDELLDLFEVITNDDEGNFRDVIIDQSNIDYSTPGDYEVIFTIKDNISGETKDVIGIYTVIDVLPTIVAIPEITLPVNSDTIDSYIKDFVVNAKEFEDFDINESISIEGLDAIPTKDGKYTTPGEYPIKFTAQDEEGNIVSVEVLLVITPEDITDEIDSEVDSEVDLEVDSEVNSEIKAEEDAVEESVAEAAKKIAYTGLENKTALGAILAGLFAAILLVLKRMIGKDMEQETLEKPVTKNVKLEEDKDNNHDIK